MAPNNYSQCFTAASEAAGRPLTDTELENFFERAQSRIGRYTREGLTPAQAAQRAGKELGEQAQLERAVEARSRKINLLTQKSLEARIIPGREYDTAMATITGVEKSWGDTLFGALTGKNKGATFEGAADSADARGNAAVGRQLGAMQRELEQAGLLKPLLKGDKQFSKDLANELGRINDPTWGKASNNKFAADAARIINKHLEDVRLQQNAAGAWIGKLDQYAGRQSHDADLIRGDGSNNAYLKWRDKIAPLLDDKTFLDHDAPADREALLHRVWKSLSDGNHEGAVGADWLGGFTGSANLAKKVSEERKLFFKSADAWHEYTEAYGHGDIRAALFKQVEHGARNAALMRMLGTNPAAMVDGFVKKLSKAAQDRGDVNQSAAIERHAGRFSGIMDYVMRKGAGSEVPTFTRVMAGMRSVQDFKLGGPLSYISDIGTIGSVMMHSGANPFEAMAGAVRGLLPKGAEAHDMAMDIGAGAEAFSGSLIAKMRAYDGVRGRLASLASTYEKLNGVKYWVNNEKEALGNMLSSNLGRKADTAFADLPARLQATLLRYGIKEPEWDAIRASKSEWADGRPRILPGDVADPNLMEKLSSYYQDQVRTGLSEPTAGITRGILGNRKDATYQSELWRALLQFKTFPATHVLRSLYRELFRGAGADVGGVAQLIAATSLLGYVSYSMKKLVRGQEPAVPTSQKGTAESIFEGMAQGGGLGIYGDFIFGQQSRFGGGPLSTALGPTFDMVNSAAGDVIGDIQKAIKGDTPAKGWTRLLASQGIDTFKRNGPMMNLWYARAAMDWAVLHSLQEMINPGYLKRYTQQLQKDQGVKFLYSNPQANHLHTFGR